MISQPPAASAQAPAPVRAVPRPRGAPRRVVLFNWRDRTHPEGGGSEQYVERVAEGLAARGHDVVLFCADHGGAPRDEMRDGVRVVRRGGRFSVYLRGLVALRTGRLGVPDVVVDVQNGVPFVSPLGTQAPVVNVVHHVHREQWPVVFGPVMAHVGWWLESRLGPRVHRRSRYVVVSAVTAAEVAELGVQPERITVVHNGAAAPLAPATPRSATPLILVLGRLVPHKRVELALETLAALRPELPELRLVVAGRGWWEPQLRARAAELGVEDAVELTGFVDEARKHALLGRAWLLLQPSLKEGWGLSVVEAAAHGTPAIAFADAGGVTESVRDGQTGLLVRSGDELTAATRRLLTDDVLRRRLGDGARAHAGDFTWAGTVAAFARVIEELAAARQTG